MAIPILPKTLPSLICEGSKNGTGEFLNKIPKRISIIILENVFLYKVVLVMPKDLPLFNENVNETPAINKNKGKIKS